MTALPRGSRGFQVRFAAWRSRVGGVAGAAVLLGLWQWVAAPLFCAHGTIPSPGALLRQFFLVDGPSFYLLAASHTLLAAAQGWLWGNGLAVLLALWIAWMPWMEKPVSRLGAVSYCLPIVAIGPVLMVIFSGDTPRIILSAMSVFFVTLIGMISGLRSVDSRVLDAIHAFGGGGWMKFTKARCRAALPSLFAALRVAAPSAILGSIVGEFLGVDNGLGVLLVNSQQGLDYPRTWTVAVFSTALAGTAYGLIGLIGHRLTPWARETHSNVAVQTAARGGAGSAVSLPWRFGGMILSAGFSVALVLLAWVLVLKVFSISPFIGKGPLDVWQFLSDPDEGNGNRAALWGESLVSLRDTLIGLTTGTLAAVSTAIVFNLAPAVRQVFIGPALALQSVPLVAMTPLIVLIFGRDLMAVAVIGGIITFFPTLVNVTLALDRTPHEAIDLMKVCGASRLETMRTVQIPQALPSLFASLRVAAPLAITGSLLAEWLATGRGTGSAIPAAQALSDYRGLWARVALVTLYSLMLYGVIGFFERLVFRRMGVM